VPTGIGTALLVGGLASGAASAAGGIMQAGAAKSAAQTEAQAAQQAAQLQSQEFQTINQEMSPYRVGGSEGLIGVENLLGIPTTSVASAAPAAPVPTGGGNALVSTLQKYVGHGYRQDFVNQIQSMIQQGAHPSDIMGALQNWGSTTTSGTNAAAKAEIFKAAGGLKPGIAPTPTPSTMTAGPSTANIQDFLSKTPGYQFALDQGTQAVENMFAAQGLSKSGPLAKGLSQYVTGLANQTYQQQLGNFMNLAGLGEQATAQTGQFGMQSVAQQNALLTGGASASAAGQIGAANALTGGLSGLTGGVSNALLLNSLNNAGMFGAGASGSGNALALPTATG
jgi:hypothetical protein